MALTPTPNKPRNERSAAEGTRTIVLFVVGCAFGLLVGFYSFSGVRDAGSFIDGIVVMGMVVGCLSTRFGRRFWEWVGRVGPWISP
jgi:hypothetical protein